MLFQPDVAHPQDARQVNQTTGRKASVGKISKKKSVERQHPE